mmetsp:Transcript_52933/g.123990  ORF Transcript_52933/g.123990 Transcript_52933/m.123990 type:complete len:307 (-) Transcript_52933:125-1045(-)
MPCRCALPAGALSALLLIVSAFEVDSLIQPSSLPLQRQCAPSPSPPLNSREGQRLCLRGGGEDEDALERLEANLAALSAKCDEMEQQFGGGQDEDVMGYTRKGMPMSYHPHNAEIVQEAEYDSDEFSGKPKRGAWEPREEDMKAGMEMAAWIEDVVEKMTPENILKGIKEMGASPDDLEPVMNRAGTRLGSIDAFDKSREKLRQTLAEVKGTHARLQESMKHKSPTDELKDEIAQMKAEEVNPYVALLHEWERLSQHEHQSGAFHKQHEAHTQPQLPVCTREEEKPRSQTTPALAALPSSPDAPPP